MNREKARQLLPIITAYAEGKAIQFRTRAEPEKWDTLPENARFDHEPGCYRIKPEWTLPQPPEGLSWHRADWTEDLLPPGYRPLLAGEKCRWGEDECLHSKESTWEAVVGLSGVSPERLESWFLRTKRPLPTLKILPLTPEEMLKAVWLKEPLVKDSLLIVKVLECGNGYSTIHSWMGLEDLKNERWSWSQDRINWHPCWKEVVE